MARDLEYKDLRRADYNTEFADEQHNVKHNKLSTTQVFTRSDGNYSWEQLEISQLLLYLEQHDRDIRELKQDNAALRGQLEYLYKNGIDGYSTKIRTIRDRHPKPTE